LTAAIESLLDFNLRKVVSIRPTISNMARKSDVFRRIAVFMPDKALTARLRNPAGAVGAQIGWYRSMLAAIGVRC
jgi:hypothetical protein